MSQKKDPEAVVREIKRKTRRKFSSEEKIRIILEGLRGEESIAELCRLVPRHVANDERHEKSTAILFGEEGRGRPPFVVRAQL